MDRFERIFELHKLLSARRYPVSRRDIEARLECSRKTVERTIQDMRDYLGAPIAYDRQANGYHYAVTEEGPFDLPGLWFDARELAALAVLDRLLRRIEPGLLADELLPMRRRIEALLEKTGIGLAHLRERVRILDIAARQPGDAFHVCAEALLAGRQLKFDYHGRSRDRWTPRSVSPQRLTHYRDNWYLDAWCHAANALRTFAVDRIRRAEPQAAPARQTEQSVLDDELATAYGIFAGPAPNTAVLDFTPRRARWVADEIWHPDQRGSWLANGRYRLEIPYGDDRELIGDILRHGPEVRVVGPDSLCARVRQAVAATAALYESTAPLRSASEGGPA